MYMVEEHYHLINHRSKVEGINREDNNMGEDVIVAVEEVKREHKGMVLTRHLTSDGPERHQQAHREWEEIAKSGYSEGHTTF
jgi:hypothetical protein